MIWLRNEKNIFSVKHSLPDIKWLMEPYTRVMKSECKFNVNSLPASGKFCHPPVIFANSLDPDQAQQTVRPDRD